MMVEGVIATFALGGLALYGLLRLIDECIFRATDAKREAADRRARAQERIHGAIYDAMRLDDPAVRYELEKAIEEYRRA